MSKKSKRQSRKTPSQRASITRPESVVVDSATKTSVEINRSQMYDSGSKSRNLKTYEPEFKPDYSQTLKDLRRIGTLAGLFFLVLIVLSFFLR